MILGSINQPALVELLGQNSVLKRSLAALRELTPDAPHGTTELEGADLYINVHGYETGPREAGRWESHRHTTDVQFCLAGGELIDWTSARPAAESASYNETKDVEHWPAAVAADETVALRPGHFAIFLPGELHRPKIADGANRQIQKAVVKIDSRLVFEVRHQRERS